MKKQVWAVLGTDDSTYNPRSVLGVYTKEEDAKKALAWWQETTDYYWIETYTLYNRFTEKDIWE